jgi:autophagy-related protein 17
MQVEFLRVSGGQLPALAEGQDSEQAGVGTSPEPKPGVDNNTKGEIIPNLPKEMVEQAYERLKARGGNFV